MNVIFKNSKIGCKNNYVDVVKQLKKMKNDMKLIIRRGSFYFGIYIATILGYCCFINFFGIYPFDTENERALITVIIESQAAIISIVITLSLVAIQITASQYSSTIIDYIKRHPDFWILLIIYLISIIIGLFSLKTLNLNDPLSASYVSFELGLAIFTFIIIVPFIKSTTTLLKSKVIVEDIAKQIEKNSVLFQDENFNLLFNIIESSMQKYDLEVTIDGLIRINGIVISIIQKSSDQEIERIFDSYFKKIAKIQFLSENLNCDFITAHTCNNYYFAIEEIIQKKSAQNLEFPISSLYNIAKRATEKKSNLLFHTSINFLTKIALMTAEKNRNDEYDITVKSILNLGKLSISLNNHNNFAICIEKLESIAEFHVSNKDDSKLKDIVLFYSILLDDAILQNFHISLDEMTISLGKISKKIILEKQKLDDSILIISSVLKKICNTSITNSQIGIFYRTYENLEDLYFYARQEKIEKVSMFCIYSFNEIINNALRSSASEEVVFWILQSQKKISENYLKQKEMKYFDVFININRNILDFLVEKRQEEILGLYIQSLSELLNNLINIKFDDESSKLINLIYIVGRSLIEKQFFDLSFIAPVDVLKEMTYDALLRKTDREKSVIFSIIKILSEAGIESSNKNLERSTKYSIICLGHLFLKCAEEGYYVGQKNIQLALIAIGLTSFNKGIEIALLSVIQQIDHISITGVKKIPDETYKQLIHMDMIFGLHALELNKPEIASDCAKQLANFPNEMKSITEGEFTKFRSELKGGNEIELLSKFFDLYHQKITEKSSNFN